MKRHSWNKPKSYPTGAIEVCKVCGATRICAIPGYHKSAAMLNGKPERYCRGAPRQGPPKEGAAVGAYPKHSPPALTAGAKAEIP